MRRSTVFVLSVLLAWVWLTAGAGGLASEDVVVEVIAQGADLHGTNGLYFGPDGNLYIASVFGREIVVMNPHTGQIIDRLGPEVGVEGPDDLVFGPDGSLYWTNIMQGEVGRMAPDGTVTTQFVALGVNPITFSPDGRLFVALCFSGDGLYELDPELIADPRPIIVATEENPYPLGMMNGFAFGPDGRLYSPLIIQGIVVSVDVGQPGDPPSADPWNDGTVQVVPTGAAHAGTLKFDPQGRLHVLDAATGEVRRVDLSTGEEKVVARPGLGMDNLAFDSDGNLFVSNFLSGAVVRILPSGQTRTLSPGGMVFPGGVAVLERADGVESVFVADAYTLRVVDGLTGKVWDVLVGLTFGGGGVIVPLTVAADGEHLIVTSWFHGQVQVWDPQTGQILEHYAMPVPLNAIRLGDDIVVADLGLGGVVWASDQAMILPMDGENVFLPAGLATDGQTLWVADWATGIIWQIGFDGKTPLAPVPVACGRVNPEGLALDGDGNLLVVEAGAKRLSRINLATGEIRVLAAGLDIGLAGPEGTPPTWAFNGVAVGPSGAIYVTGDVTNVLYRIWVP